MACRVLAARHGSILEGMMVGSTRATPPGDPAMAGVGAGAGEGVGHAGGEGEGEEIAEGAEESGDEADAQGAWEWEGGWTLRHNDIQLGETSGTRMDTNH
ncbi:hypothetical protein LTR62_004338 [Meristemomyces frigidus]|uniref:Uncharacterized protein n=1 Tax=Meristemomyces frigidus TaxID=1508187 RepID=A0AAN7TFM8_9PEZI|nr:hypothetical protein LTR62_004338 [Meristemomyces frigidus]